jgi:hypothetical protein
VQDVRAGVAELGRLSAAELERRYAEVVGRPARSKNRAFLQRRVAWKLQERTRGGLPPAAVQRLQELTELLDPLADAAARAKRREQDARDSSPPRQSCQQPREIRLPKPGSLIRRVYKGREIVVRVLNAGFEYDGRHYRSLSAIATAVTGAHWNGLLFFRLVTQKK